MVSAVTHPSGSPSRSSFCHLGLSPTPAGSASTAESPLAKATPSRGSHTQCVMAAKVGPGDFSADDQGPWSGSQLGSSLCPLLFPSALFLGCGSQELNSISESVSQRTQPSSHPVFGRQGDRDLRMQPIALSGPESRRAGPENLQERPELGQRGKGGGMWPSAGGHCLAVGTVGFPPVQAGLSDAGPVRWRALWIG